MLDWKEHESLEGGLNLHAGEYKEMYQIHRTPHAGLVYLTIRLTIGNQGDPIEQAKNIAQKIDDLLDDA